MQTCKRTAYQPRAPEESTRPKQALKHSPSNKPTQTRPSNKLNGLRIEVRSRETQRHLLEFVDQELRHREVAEPFAICGHYVPGGVLGGTPCEHRLECLRVGGPLLTLLQIAGIEFPVLAPVREALLETQPLLFLADLQENFYDPGVAGRQQALEVVDLFVAAAPDIFRNEIIHANDEHVFVVRAVEHRDLAPRRCMFVDA